MMNIYLMALRSPKSKSRNNVMPSNYFTMLLMEVDGSQTADGPALLLPIVVGMVWYVIVVEESSLLIFLRID
jgi:hypothetical protein